MEIILTRHAELRMKTRNVSLEMVKDALKNPDIIQTGYKNRNIAYKIFKSRKLKVVYVQEEGKNIIITAMWEE